MPRGFVVVQEAWYWDANRRFYNDPEIQIHSDADGDGVDWEFAIRWHDLGRLGEPRLTPQVCLFDDAWAAWLEMPEFFGRLARLEDRSPAGVVAMLLASGFVDVTERERRSA